MGNGHSNRKSKATNSGWLARFFRSEKDFPVLAAIGAGLYPVFFYFTNNYTLINTWGHLGYFALMFLLVPIVVFVLAHRISALKVFRKISKYVLPFLNVFVFLFLLKVCLYAGLQKKITLLIFVLAALFAFFLYKHLKKVIIFQLILALIGVFTVIPKVISQINYSDEWMRQPDDIMKVGFVKKPNVYLIQPDGYVNFSELNKGYYDLDNGNFESYLTENNFVNYPNFRSNYASTLTSNTATFVMKHHYYNKGTNFGEAINARNVIITSNPVLNIFKQNGYITHFMAQKPYLLLNKPEIGYHKSNFKLGDVAYIGTGLGEPQDLMDPLKKYMEEDTDKPKFYFMEFFNPGHINNSKSNTLGREEERKLWLESLDRANDILTDMIDMILEKDPNALIIVMADHGGFVGFDYSQEIYRKTQDRDLIYSIFSSQFSVHWPNGDRPSAIADSVNSPVNLFRGIFSYLSENDSYLDHLEADESYVILNKDAPKGIYKYIDDDGNIVLEKH